jgi:hypothetical protein
MPNIKRLVIFGDSLSDIGNMHKRSFIDRQAHTNEHGRFSDGKNWVDYLYKVICPDKEKKIFYRQDPEKSFRAAKSHLRLHLSSDGSLEFANYAEGGAVGWHKTKGESAKKKLVSRFLDTLDGQLKEFFGDWDRYTSVGGDTLFIIWMGANDVVTVERDEENLVKVARNVFRCAERLAKEVPGSHVVIIGLPDLERAPRFAGEPQKVRDRIKQKRALFNRTIDDEAAERRSDRRAPHAAFIHVYQIGMHLTEDYVAQWGLSPLAQPEWGVPPWTGIGPERVEEAEAKLTSKHPVTENWQFGAVHDDLHPTERGYEIAAFLILCFLDGAEFKFYRAGRFEALTQWDTYKHHPKKPSTTIPTRSTPISTTTRTTAPGLRMIGTPETIGQTLQNLRRKSED